MEIFERLYPIQADRRALGACHLHGIRLSQRCSTTGVLAAMGQADRGYSCLSHGLLRSHPAVRIGFRPPVGS